MHNSEFAVVRKKLHREHLFHLVRKMKVSRWLLNTCFSFTITIIFLNLSVFQLWDLQEICMQKSYFRMLSWSTLGDGTKGTGLDRRKNCTICSHIKVFFYSKAALELAWNLDCLSSRSKAVGLCTTSPHHLLMGSQLSWEVCLRPCSSL